MYYKEKVADFNKFYKEFINNPTQLLFVRALNAAFTASRYYHGSGSKFDCEACKTFSITRVTFVNMFAGYKIRASHPMKLRILNWCDEYLKSMTLSDGASNERQDI